MRQNPKLTPLTHPRQGKKWVVEYVTGNPGLEISTTETNQSVYIYQCENSTIQIQERSETKGLLFFLIDPEWIKLS